ncbi:MAG: TRAP transporter small permease, partial [Bosea sp. (in: a-proteobacteria)]|uniref:TRAP transporter small permease n=1 Tax=Bosea sp. (in: a-proteobacteria) TaxID=1871050 RepID=UPI003F7CACD5
MRRRVETTGALDRAEARLRAALEIAGASILAALFGVVMVAVLRRYLLGGGFVWSDELATWLFLALVAVGAPLAVTGPLAMRLDVVVKLLPAGGRRAAGLLAEAIAFQGAFVLAMGGASVAMLVGGSSTVLGLPEWLRFAGFAGAGGLTALLLFLHIRRERTLA